MALQRSLNKFSMLAVSVGAMVGSGWLFGALYAAQIAGPLAIFSWILGGVLMMLVALNFAELAAMLPITGGIARFPQFSHGPMTSYVMTWIAWLAYVLLPPIEVQALLQYAANYLPWLIHTINGTPELSSHGLIIAAILLLLMSWLNVIGIKLVTRFNNVLVFVKIIIPLFTAIVLFIVAFHSSNFTETAVTQSHGMKELFMSLPLAGVVFSFFGFRMSIELAGEAHNPQRALPLALLGSITICIVLYTVVQTAFIGALNPVNLVNGWNHLSFAGDYGPFVGVAAGLGLVWLVVILYIDAVVSPFGSALMVVTTTSRLNYAMAMSGYAPKFLTHLNKQQVPYWAIWVNFIVGLLLLLPFPGWQKLATFIISALVVSHSIAPISLIALRKQIPAQKRPFKLPYAHGLSLLAFIVLNFLAYWTGWDTMWKMFAAALISLVILGVYRLFQKDKPRLYVKNALWLIPYFGGMALFSYFGNFGGGRNSLPFGWDMAMIAVFATVIFYIGVSQALPAALTRQQISQEKSLLPADETDTLV